MNDLFSKGRGQTRNNEESKPTREELSFSLQPQTPEAAFAVEGDNLATAFLGIPVKQDHTVESLLCEICQGNAEMNHTQGMEL